MRLLIAKHNAGKVKEIRRLFGHIYESIVSLGDIGMDIEIEETGTTFEENARIKAEGIFALARDYDVLADDSGLEVDALGGVPGVYSARYSGEGATDNSNNELLLERMRDIEAERRTARFVSCVALKRKEGLLLARGECGGRILFEPKGSGGFGYDPLFHVPEFDMTFGELTLEQKNTISHRGRALSKLAELIDNAD